MYSAKTFALFISILIWLASCTNEESRQKPAAENTLPDSVIAAEGRKAAMRLGKSLQSHLKTQFQENGALGAVQYCEQRAISLTRQAEEQKRFNVSLKRTSLNYRNPENQPDSLESEVLKQLKNEHHRGEMPKYHIYRDKSGKKQVYHYFQPITMKKLCLNCHGNPGQMDEDLKVFLNRAYPQDRATGYEEGDFRGVIHVSLVDAK